jgi:hypothetical protein
MTDGLALWRQGSLKAGFPDGQSGFVVLNLGLERIRMWKNF